MTKRLISALLATNHPPVNKAVAEANIATILLDLFFKYSLNNFLHAQVKKGVGLCTYDIGILHILFSGRELLEEYSLLERESSS